MTGLAFGLIQSRIPLQVPHMPWVCLHKVPSRPYGIFSGDLDQTDHLTGVSNLLASLGHTGRRRVVLDHPLNTQTLTITHE